jgi:hypothetical protein
VGGALGVDRTHARPGGAPPRRCHGPDVRVPGVLVLVLSLCLRPPLRLWVIDRGHACMRIKLECLLCG